MTTFHRRKKPPKIPLSCIVDYSNPSALYDPNDETPILWFGYLFSTENFNITFFTDYQYYDIDWGIFRIQFQSVFVRKYSNRYLQSWVLNLLGEYDSNGEFTLYTGSRRDENYSYIAQSIFSSYNLKWTRWLSQLTRDLGPDADGYTNNEHIHIQRSGNQKDTDTRKVTHTVTDKGTDMVTKEFGDVTETGTGNDKQTLSDSSNKNTNAQNSIYGFNGAGNPRDSGTGSESSNSNTNGSTSSTYDKTISRRDDVEVHDTNKTHNDTETHSGGITVETTGSETTFWLDPFDWLNKVITSTKWTEVVDLICEDIAKATLLSIY